MKVFGKTLREYIGPVWYYVAGAILVVFSQYYLAVPLTNAYGLPFILNITQALWALMVVFSAIKLTVNYDFSFKQILFLGVIFSFVIHGLKAFVFRVFLFPYSDPTMWQYFLHILDRFFYGSFLVMAIAAIIGLVFIRLRNEPEVKKECRRL